MKRRRVRFICVLPNFALGRFSAAGTPSIFLPPFFFYRYFYYSMSVQKERQKNCIQKIRINPHAFIAKDLVIVIVADVCDVFYKKKKRKIGKGREKKKLVGLETSQSQVYMVEPL